MVDSGQILDTEDDVVLASEETEAFMAKGRGEIKLSDERWRSKEGKEMIGQ